MRKLTLATFTLIAVFMSFSAYAQINKVLSLDGDGDYVEVLDDDSLDVQMNLTLECWIYIRDTQNQITAPISKANTYMLHLRPAYMLHLRPEGNTFQLDSLVWVDGHYGPYPSSAEVILNPNTWYHVAATYNGTVIKTYVNGVNLANQVRSGSIDVTSFNLALGWDNRFDDRKLYGLIDEARIWNVARTQEQIQATMNTTLTGNEEGLVGYWNFDDGTANGLTANNNDGTLNGDANIVDQYYVSPSGNDANEGSKENPFKTIQHAIDQSGRGDVITALPGTYEENITLVGDLTLQGSGTDQTIITASGGNVVSADDVHNVTLSGFTIDGQGTADNGILCSGSTSELEIRNNTITNATNGIYCIDSAKTLIEGNRIEQNLGYGILCGGSSKVEIEENVISQNTRNGVRCIDDTIVEINSNKITENRNSGISCTNNANVTIAYNFIDSNTYHDGLSCDQSAVIHLHHNTISNNTGMGIRCHNDAELIISDNLIQNNDFSGIWCGGTTHLTVIRNIISNNNHAIGTATGSFIDLQIGGSLKDGNSITANIGFSIVNRTDQTITATYNYWGTDDETEIENMILNTGSGSIIFKPFIGDPELIGNVSGSGGITAYDASLILQYCVGLIDHLPANISYIGENITPRNRTIRIPNVSVKINELISVPIIIDETSDLVAGGVTIEYDHAVLKATGIKVTPESLLNNTYWQSNIDNDEIRLAFTKNYMDEANQSNILAILEFEAIGNIEGITTDLVIDHAQIAESIAIAKVDGHITFLPSKTVLMQNYPNPFNPETWIPFKLSDNADVVVSIYDIGGQLVRNIGLGRMSAGMYVNKDKAVYWDGRNSSGEQISSGLYFYTLQAGSYSATKRMLILK